MLYPASRWGSLQRSPNPQLYLRDPTHKENGREDWKSKGKEESNRKKGDGKEKEREKQKKEKGKGSSSILLSVLTVACVSGVVRTKKMTTAVPLRLAIYHTAQA